MTTKQQRETRKEQLLAQIQQQRQDTSQLTRQWLDYTAPLDYHWQTLVKVRQIAFIGAGIAILYSMRKPANAVKISKMILKIWGITHLAQRLSSNTKNS